MSEPNIEVVSIKDAQPKLHKPVVPHEIKLLEQ